MPVTLVKSKWVDGNLVFYDKDDSELLTFDGNVGALHSPDGLVFNTRQRFTAAQVNSGADVLPALSGYQYRVVDATLIAIGGDASGATSVDLLSTQSTSSAKLIAAAVAALTQSAVVRTDNGNVTVLADGASFVANDAGAAVTIGKTGSNLATATHIDVILDYVIEAA